MAGIKRLKLNSSHFGLSFTYEVAFVYQTCSFKENIKNNFECSNTFVSHMNGHNR